jgi:serine/threonine-protein kinase HipA
MNRSGKVYLKNVFCGVVSETDAGYLFEYSQEYLTSVDAQAVSLTLPLTDKPFQSKTLFA